MEPSAKRSKVPREKTNGPAPPSKEIDLSDLSDGDDDEYDLAESLAPLLLSSDGASTGESLAQIAKAVTATASSMERFFEKFLRLQKVQARKLQEIVAILDTDANEEDADPVVIDGGQGQVLG